MISKYLKYQLTFILMLLLSITGCKDNTDIDNFSETPSARLANVKSDLKQALISSKDGWKMIYFPNNSEFGGFTHLMSFTDDGKVKMASDFNKNALVPEVSEYEIQMGYSAALVFTTRNKIHLLSDSENSPGKSKGSGYSGSFEFVLDKIDENGNIHFKASRGGSVIVFTKATADDWTNLKKNFDTEANLSPLTTFYTIQLQLKDGDKIQSYSLNYNKTTRFLNINSGDSEATHNNTNYGIGFKENAIVLNPAIKIGNDELSELVYDTTSMSYIAKGSQGEVKIKYDLAGDPGQYTSFIDRVLSKKYTTGSFRNDSGDLVSSSLAKSIYASATNPNFTYIDFYFNIRLVGQTQTSNYIDYTLRGRTGYISAQHYFDIEKGENNTVIFKHKSWQLSGTKEIPDAVKTFDNYLFDPKGLLIREYPVPTKFGSRTAPVIGVYSTLSLSGVNAFVVKL